MLKWAKNVMPVLSFFSAIVDDTGNDRIVITSLSGNTLDTPGQKSMQIFLLKEQYRQVRLFHLIVNS